MMNQVIYLLIGLAGGMLSGAFGIGGGTLMVPFFVLVLGMNQLQAQGTALAVMLPPVFLLAVLRYYKAGHVDVPMAAVIAVGFTLGALIGAHLIQDVPPQILRRAFGIFLLIVGIKMAFFR